MTKTISITLLIGVLSFFNACKKNDDNAGGTSIAATATINLNQIIVPNIVGNGAQWDAYPLADAAGAAWGDIMTDAEWQKLYDRLDYMQPQFIRVMDQATDRYFFGMENNQPIVNFDNDEMRTLYKLLDYCCQNDITIAIGEWGFPWHGGPGGQMNSHTDQRWFDMIADFLEHLIVEKGYACLKYYNYINEPNGDWSSINGDFDLWADGVEGLANTLEARGLSDDIQITGPGSVPQYNNPNSNISGSQWVDQSVNSSDEYLGAYEIHTYPTYEWVREGQFAQRMSINSAMTAVNTTGKPFFIGEAGFKGTGAHKDKNDQLIENDPYAGYDSQMQVYNFQYGVDMADLVVQAMNSGVAGVIAWSMDDAMHTDGDDGTITRGDASNGSGGFKRWGFWNILGEELTGNADDEKIRPWYYPWSWLCKYFPNGSDIVNATINTSEAVRVLAAKNGNEISITFVNNSVTAMDITLEIENGGNASFQELRYLRENWDAETKEMTVEKNNHGSGNGITIDLPLKSVVVLTTFDF